MLHVVHLNDMARPKRLLLVDALSEPLGKRLARLRKDRGITQSELAAQLHISQANVSDYERGKCRLHGDIIVQIIRILGVTSDEFLGIAPSPKASALQDRRFLQRLAQIDRLSKRNKEALLRTINAFLAQVA